MKILQSFLSTTLALASLLTTCQCVPLTQTNPSQDIFDLDSTGIANSTNSSLSSSLNTSMITNQLQLDPYSRLPRLNPVAFSHFIVEKIDRAQDLVDSQGRNTQTSETFISSKLGISFTLSPAIESHGLYTYGALLDTVTLLQRQIPGLEFQQVDFQLYSAGSVQDRKSIGRGSLVASGPSATNGAAANTSSIISNPPDVTNVSVISAVPANLTSANRTGSLQKIRIQIDVNPFPGAEELWPVPVKLLLAKAQGEVQHSIDQYGTNQPVPSPWQCESDGFILQMSRRVGTDIPFTYGVLQDVILTLEARGQASGYKQSKISVWLNEVSSGELIAQGSLRSSSLQTAANASVIGLKSLAVLSNASTITVPLNSTVASLTEPLQKQTFSIGVSPQAFALMLSAGTVNTLLVRADAQVQALLEEHGTSYPAPGIWTTSFEDVSLNLYVSEGLHVTYGAIEDVIQKLDVTMPQLSFMSCDIIVRSGLAAGGDQIARGTITKGISSGSVANASSIVSNASALASNASALTTLATSSKAANLTEQTFSVSVVPQPFGLDLDKNSVDALLQQAEAQVQALIAQHGSQYQAPTTWTSVVPNASIKLWARAGWEELFTLGAIENVIQYLENAMPRLSYKSSNIMVRQGTTGQGPIIARGTLIKPVGNGSGANATIGYAGPALIAPVRPVSTFATS